MPSLQQFVMVAPVDWDSWSLPLSMMETHRLYPFSLCSLHTKILGPEPKKWTQAAIQTRRELLLEKSSRTDPSDSQGRSQARWCTCVISTLRWSQDCEPQTRRCACGQRAHGKWRPHWKPEQGWGCDTVPWKCVISHKGHLARTCRLPPLEEITPPLEGIFYETDLFSSCYLLYSFSLMLGREVKTWHILKSTISEIHTCPGKWNGTTSGVLGFLLLSFFF